MFDDFDSYAAPEPPRQQPAPAPPRAPPPAGAPAPRPAQPVLPLQQLPLPPRPVANHIARAKAGMGLVMAAAGAGLGAVLGGPMGAAAGLVGTGAARNLLRAQGIASADPDVREQAAKSLALGVVGLGLVGFIAWKIMKEDA